MRKVTYSDIGVSHAPPAPDSNTCSASDDSIDIEGHTVSLPRCPYHGSAFFGREWPDPQMIVEARNLIVAWWKPNLEPQLAHLRRWKTVLPLFEKPPAWRLYKIGSGACGTVFLEKVRTHRIEFLELWVVKRIPQALPKLAYQAVSSSDRELAGTISGKLCPNLPPVIMGTCLFNLHWIWR